MKKHFLSLILLCCSAIAFSQSPTVTLFATGATGSFTTGSATTTTRTDDVIMATSTTDKGYAVFDLSGIPVDATIISCVLGFHVSSFTAGTPDLCNTYGYPGDLSLVTTPATLFADISSGTLLFSAIPPADGSYGGSTGHDSMESSTAPLTTFIHDNLGGKISIGFTGGGTNVYGITGETGLASTYGIHAPYLRIHYTPPCSGTPSAGAVISSVPSACATLPVTLTNIGYYPFPGITFQWQSSPDSSTWTDIAGATAATYVAPGITATTYFRSTQTCTFSGLSSVSAGKKITSLPCCSGTPPVGTTSTGASSCSACTLTLDLPGYPALAGLTFQWQKSVDNVTWTNISGATSIPYSFAPYGPYYFRCKVTCTPSGLLAYSTSSYVAYPLHLVIADSVRNPGYSWCPPPRHYTTVNGNSALLRLKTFYGDGLSDSLAFATDSANAYIDMPHAYNVSGIYTIKKILYFDNTAIDSVTFYYDYRHCNGLSARFYFDLNSDCIKQTTETWNSNPVNVKIDSNGVPIDTLSITSGYYYRAWGPPGTVYTFSMLSLPAFYVSCPGSGVWSETISTGGAYPMRQIGLNCFSTGGIYDLSVNMSLLSGMNLQRGLILIHNSYCNPTDAVVTLHYSPKYNIVDFFSPYPVSTTANTATWLLPDLFVADTGDAQISYGLKVLPLLAMGDTVHTHVTVSPVSGDANPTNNSMIIIDTVLASYDPNEISVKPSGCIDAAETITQLEYTIHFENLGNDTAHNVHVMDTLSDYLDVKSLEIVLASNTMYTSVYKDGIYNIAKFDFPNIKLWDSSHYAERQGMFIYKIKTKPSLALGSQVKNRVGIYFDINEVVMTNQVSNTKGCPPAGINGTQYAGALVQLSPNPVKDVLTITVAHDAYNSFNITDCIGKQYLHRALDNTATIDVSTLPAGLYYITFHGTHDTETRKFVKW
ncbi:MAG: T9SS type A sorting domain-containing protein [Bacteroidota bacterium]